MSNHVAPRRRRPALTSAVVLATVAAVAVGSGAATPAVADSAPQRVLQSVNVDLGADGTLHGVTSTNVRRGEGGAEGEEVELSPRDSAGELPVRITTAYRTDDGSGTDLSELRGHDGRVEIDITVQNTTVRPEAISYDDDGARRDTFALVGAPLTVVASAVLDGSVSRVVTTSDTGQRVSNGVVSQDGDGNAQVQWAALLAPPRLSPNSTFTLVLDADDFALPSLDISVQPGLATDPSIEALLTQAFGDQRDSQLQQETRTIELVTQVTTVLAQAGQQLGRVRDELSGSASTLGTKTIADLRTGTRTVQESTERLDRQLRSLQDGVGESLRGTQSTAGQAIDSSISNVVALLGDPTAAPTTPAVSGTGCGAQVQDTPRSSTVFGQLSSVITLLDGLAGATAGCSSAIADSLVLTIGSVDAAGVPVCTGASAASAICTLENVRTELAGLGDELAKGFAQASSTLGTVPQAVAAAGEQVTGLEEAVKNLRATTARLGGTSEGEGLGSLLGQLEQTQQELLAVFGENTSASTLRARLNTIREVALDRRSALSEGDFSVQRQVAELDKAICEASLGGLDLGKVDSLRKLTSGKDCKGQPLGSSGGYSAPILDRLELQRAGWDSVLAADAQALSALDGLGGAVADVAQTIDAITSAPVNGLQATIIELEDQLDGLSDDDPATTDRVAALRAALGGITLGSDQVDTDLKGQLDALQARVKASSDAVRAQQRVIDTRRLATNDELAKLFLVAAGGLQRAGATIEADGQQTVRTLDQRLSAEGRDLKRSLAASVSTSLGDIERDVTASNRDLESSRTLLTQDLQNVLSDLGTGDSRGAGLLGIVQGQAAQARTSAARLGAAGTQAAEFGNVRRAGLSGFFLQQAQLTRALELQQALPAVGLDLPEGSQHVSVFTFHMREIR